MNILGFATGISTMTEGATTSAHGTTSGTYLAPYTKECGWLYETEPANILRMRIEPSYYFWFSHYRYSDGYYWNERSIALFKNGSGNTRYALRSTGSETYEVEYYNGTRWERLTRIGGGVLYNGVHRLDMEFSADAIRLYVDGSLYAYYVGEIPQVDDPIEIIDFYAADDRDFISSAFAADEDTREIVMVQHEISADGTHHNDFAGSYDDINNFATLGNTGAVSTEVAGASQTYDVVDMQAPFTLGFNILAVGIYARAASDNSGVVNNMTTIVSDGVNTAESGDQAMDAIMKPRLGVHYTAPDGTAWDVAKFNAAEFGLRTKA